MGRQQCKKCTRFFDPSDPKDPCWCAPPVVADSYVKRATEFFMSCYNSVIPSRSEIVVNYLVEHLDTMPPSQRYDIVAHAAKASTPQEVRGVLASTLSSHLGTVPALPPLVSPDVCRLMGIPTVSTDAAEAHLWIQERLLTQPVMLSCALQGWLADLGFPKTFCNNLTLEYSVELAEWLLGVRRG